jgi:hypothetical protein
MMSKTQREPSSEEIFNHLKMFNQIITLDEEFAAQFPVEEFELSFTSEGDIYVDGKAVGVNVKERFAALALQ